MEFSINKLQRRLELEKEPIIIHDDWFYNQLGIINRNFEKYWNLEWYAQIKYFIEQFEDSVRQQAIIISQNEEVLAQNKRLFEELSDMNKTVNRNLGNINANLSSINESSIETSQWAKIAALNTETCAWIGFSNFIKGWLIYSMTSVSWRSPLFFDRTRENRDIGKGLT